MDAFIIAVYFIAVFGVGFYHSRNKNTTTEYFLAGKHIGWFALGATLFSTNIGSEHVIGLAGSGASSGLAVRYLRVVSELLPAAAGLDLHSSVPPQPRLHDARVP